MNEKKTEKNLASSQNKNMFKLGFFVVFVSLYLSAYVFCKDPNNYIASNCKVGAVKYYADLAFDFIWNVFLAGAPFLIIGSIVFVIGDLLSRKLKLEKKKCFFKKIKSCFALDLLLSTFLFAAVLDPIFALFYALLVLVIQVVFSFLIKGKGQEKNTKPVKFCLLEYAAKISKKVIHGFFYAFCFAFFYLFLVSYLEYLLPEKFLESSIGSVLLFSILGVSSSFLTLWLAPVTSYISAIEVSHLGSVFAFLLAAHCFSRKDLMQIKNSKKKYLFLSLSFLFSILLGYLVSLFAGETMYRFQYGEAIFPDIVGQVSVGILVVVYVVAILRGAFLSLKEEIKEQG